MNGLVTSPTAPWLTAGGSGLLTAEHPGLPVMPLDYDSILEPGIFWFWNAAAGHDSIRRRLDDFLAKGIRAVYVHPMPDDFRRAHFLQGMPVPYLSDEFFDLIAYTCEQIRQRDMLLWLYDEGGWPSGVAGGQVVAANRDYGLWALTRREGKIVPVQSFLKEGFPDLMNPEATRCFIEATHEKYRQCIGNEFGRTVRGIFTDEPRLGGRLGTDFFPWSPLLPDAWAEQNEDSLCDLLPLLFVPDPADARVRLARRRYMAAISTLIARNYYSEIRTWCERWGLLFEGHHSGEDEFSKHGRYFGDFLEQARHYHIPGVDTIWRQLFPQQKTGNYVSLASSISWLRGQRCALSESFNVYGAGLTLQQMYWISAFQIVRGVNKIAFMPSLDDTSEVRWISMGTDISPKTPLWRDFDLIVDFVRKAAKFSASGQALPSVGMFYRSELVPETEAQQFDAAHEHVCNHIQDSLSGLAFVGQQDIEAGEVRNGNLSIGPVQLSALVVHVDGALTAEESALLNGLAGQGLAVWQVDNGPAQNGAKNGRNGSAGAGHIRHVSCCEEIDLTASSPLIVDRELTGVRLLPMREGDRHSLLFFNQNPHPLEFSFRFREAMGETALQEFALDDDLVRELHPLSVRDRDYFIRLDAGQMRAFHTSEREAPAAAPWKIEAGRTLELQWQIEEEERYLLGEDVEIESAYDSRRAETLGDYSAIKPDFSGSLCYHSEFAYSEAAEGRVLLDLGTVYYSAEVFVNGQSCGRRAWGPFVFDITAALQAGDNELVVRVTNTLANQWACHEIDTEPLLASGNPYIERTSEYALESLHAGLVGPVTIQKFAMTQA